MSAYSTDELAKGLVSLRDFGEVNLSIGGVDGLVDAIIAKLRAGDKLRDGMVYLSKTATSDSVREFAVKAIADYEGKP